MRNVSPHLNKEAERQRLLKAEKDWLGNRKWKQIHEILAGPMGSLRRAAILAWLKEPDVARNGDTLLSERLLFVNKKYQPRTDDPDLKVLIKKGILVQARRARWGVRSKESYLKLK